ncbi:unnamed protein product [Rotaria socialis]|uniref:Uncharacterized protein n=1 Tax=Rotaria socialis TaxID=392032 RepID=A0A818NBJ1_9BILA|nr:unnamed protein product [Rotaria socialis]CAF4385423.1 unnamed protein product [Rotaria socialis]
MGLYAFGSLQWCFIYHVTRIRRNSTIQKSRIQHRSMPITSVVTTVLFLIMTMPATLCLALFFRTMSYFILLLFDSILYTYHVLSSFIIYITTFNEFRKEAFVLFIPDRWYNVQPAVFRLTEARNVGK